MKKLFALLLLVLSFSANAQQVNVDGLTALASAARTAATVNSADLSNSKWKGGHIIFDVTAYTSGTYTPHIQGFDPVSGKYYDLLVATGGNVLSATGTTVLKVHPGINPVAGGSSNDVIPPTWRVQLIGSSPIMTLSVSYILVE